MIIVKYLFAAVISSVLFFAIFFWLYLSGTNTRYCPLSHILDDLSVCFILDSVDDRVLIQHGELDTNDFYLEIIESGESSKFQFPSSVVNVGRSGYSAQLIANDRAAILINDEIFVLKKYTGSY
ncbi:hypothetical protein [Shewanella violacea]|uniref:Uncharacterized protein n=1 Tax=Shewanella violacea (strain JCM 10179 / CIP 106290 / LMG 19151 / DSS12) TaxID=637905 RepID=D4ZJ39_SHEVD|nr:hypothetical protein [Shewanella violacea]BAJ01688.1 hypothetical protein SVI_1717 [Shewanella violacea DSS12]